MKKLLSLILVLALCLGLLVLPASAADTVTVVGENCTIRLTGVLGQKDVKVTRTIYNEDYSDSREETSIVTVYVIASLGSTVYCTVQNPNLSFFPGQEIFMLAGETYQIVDGGQFMGMISTERGDKQMLFGNSQADAKDVIACIGVDDDAEIWYSHDLSLLDTTPDLSAYTPSAWAEEELLRAAQSGLMTEHTSSGFRTNITRFQFAELIVNLVENMTHGELEPAPADTFTDCSEPAVLKAYAAGIVNGVGNNRFAPDATTNREQIAAMVFRAVGYIQHEMGVDYLTQTGDLEKFTDKDQVSSWAVNALEMLAANGIMNGTSATTLSPKNPCTVEQSILLIYRFLQRSFEY